MVGFAKVGTFCPNPVCPDYEQVRENEDNIVKFGHTGGGVLGSHRYSFQNTL